MRSKVAVATLMGLMLMVSRAIPAAQTVQQKSTIDGVRHELMKLPYYGVFDFLAFNYDKGTVTLQGYAYRPVLKKDAERAVKRVAGVDQVIDKIEELSVSFMDDEIRWATYYKIYGDPFLSRYAPGGGLLWGHRHPFGSGMHPMGPGPFLGYEPAGDYPIHIIVNNGRTRLLGVVDNESDKSIAGMRAREVPSAFAVENDLMIEGAPKSTRR